MSQILYLVQYNDRSFDQTLISNFNRRNQARPSLGIAVLWGYLLLMDLCLLMGRLCARQPRWSVCSCPICLVLYKSINRVL